MLAIALKIQQFIWPISCFAFLNMAVPCYMIRVVTCFLFPVFGKFLSGGKYTLALALGLCYMFPVSSFM